MVQLQEVALSWDSGDQNGTTTGQALTNLTLANQLFQQRFKVVLDSVKQSTRCLGAQANGLQSNRINMPAEAASWAHKKYPSYLEVETYP